jgi:hypothetical protein
MSRTERTKEILPFGQLMLESFTGERQEMTRRERIYLFIVFSCSNRTQHWSTRTKLYLINFCQFGSNRSDKSWTRRRSVRVLQWFIRSSYKKTIKNIGLIDYWSSTSCVTLGTSPLHQYFNEYAQNGSNHLFGSLLTLTTNVRSLQWSRFVFSFPRFDFWATLELL